MFGLLSTSPGYSAKIKPFVALSPMTQIKNMKSPLKYLADSLVFKTALKAMSGPFLPSSRLIKYINGKFCFSSLKWVCEEMLFSLFGYDENQMNRSRVNVYMSHSPAGTSMYTILHYLQLVKNPGLLHYDYGSNGNMARYGQPMPPNYRLDTINNRFIALIYGTNDWLVDFKDLMYLKSTLKVPLLEDYAVPNSDWTQLDFIWAKEAGLYVNSKVLEILELAHNL
jgi:hypothetical protein